MSANSLRCVLGLAVMFMVGSACADEDILIDNFESEDFGEWKVEGEAFGEGPVRGTYGFPMEIAGSQGVNYVNSYQNGDDLTGTLTSPTFTIERDSINFLIGGGGFQDKTCMNLIINGGVVRTATGSNSVDGFSEALDWQSWDVRELKGKKARIQIVDDHKGERGRIMVDHIIQSDHKMEMRENVTRDFTFNKKYLNFPVKIGAVDCFIHVLINNELVREFAIALAPHEPDFWVYMELDEFEDKDATVRIDRLNVNNTKGFDSIFQADTFPGEDKLYKERHRAQFHFSTKRGWSNDPNGLVYYAGEFHLFYQHNPFGILDSPWGNIAWGHAVSKDLVHWTELGDAIHPDERGIIFSGSGVVDWHNTTGFQTGDEPPLVCIYTSAGTESPWSKGQPFTQSMAYSNDRGRTWTKYEENPVQGHLNGYNRDAKAIWLEETNEWAIVLYLSEERMAFFRSPDLKHWEIQSILKSFHECPELFELPVDGNEDNKKWVLYGADGAYFVGAFNGNEFIPEGERVKYNYGDAFYASQTFSDVPEDDGRRIQIGWARISTPGMPFNQMMNFPVVLTLRTTDDGIRMCANPVDEIEKLHEKTHSFNDKVLKPGQNLLSTIKGDLFDIRAEFEVKDAPEIGFDIRGMQVVYNAEKKTISCKGETSPCRPKDGIIKLQILVDRTSIEIFVNDGEYFMPMGSIPDDSNKSIGVYAKGGEARIKSLDVNELKSAWQ